MKNLTKQEKIIVALMRGHHLSKEELEIAKEQVRVLELHIKNRIL
jgi:hypothetical protein